MWSSIRSRCHNPNRIEMDGRIWLAWNLIALAYTVCAGSNNNGGQCFQGDYVSFFCHNHAKIFFCGWYFSAEKLCVITTEKCRNVIEYIALQLSTNLIHWQAILQLVWKLHKYYNKIPLVETFLRGIWKNIKLALLVKMYILSLLFCLFLFFFNFFKVKAPFFKLRSVNVKQISKFWYVQIFIDFSIFLFYYVVTFFRAKLNYFKFMQ